MVVCPDPQAQLAGAVRGKTHARALPAAEAAIGDAQGSGILDIAAEADFPEIIEIIAVETGLLAQCVIEAQDIRGAAGQAIDVLRQDTWVVQRIRRENVAVIGRRAIVFQLDNRCIRRDDAAVEHEVVAAIPTVAAGPSEQRAALVDIQDVGRQLLVGAIRGQLELAIADQWDGVRRW